MTAASQQFPEVRQVELVDEAIQSLFQDEADRAGDEDGGLPNLDDVLLGDLDDSVWIAEIQWSYRGIAAARDRRGAWELQSRRRDASFSVPIACGHLCVFFFSGFMITIR